MKNLLKLTLAATLACALPVWACTPEEATAKREQLAKEVAKLTEQNPTKAKEIKPSCRKWIWVRPPPICRTNAS